MGNILRNIRFIIREELGRHLFFYPLFKLKKKPQAKLISQNTQLVIEGLQRSGNTFMVAYLKLTNPEVIISSHYHILSQVKAAVKRRCPVIILVRNPRETVPSLMMRDSAIHPAYILKYTKIFFTELQQYRDDIVLSDFAETISQPNKVIEIVNKKFNTNFNCPEIDLILKRKINHLIEEMDKISRGEAHVDEMMVSRPSVVRKNYKKELMEHLALYEDLFSEAEKAYIDILTYSNQKNHI